MELAKIYKLKIGDKAPDFNLPAVEGGNFTLDTFPLPYLVIFFTCNHCPYALAYTERVKDAQQDFGGEVDFVGINSNDAESHPADSFEKMMEFRKENFINYMYLHDETQETAKAYGAQCTPHFFIFDKERKLVYQGRFDDNYEDASSVTKNDLRDALQALIDGKEISPNLTEAFGCSIKWKPGNEPNK
tara:strand:+ start:1835 stop:2398 length:564 start_codon:yes stop_codon:yes gene_type:complete